MKSVMLYRPTMGDDTCAGIVKHSKELSAAVANVDPYPDDVGLVVRWGCTSNTPDGATIINSAKAIHRVFDKAGFRRILMEAGGDLCPITYFDGEDVFPDDLHDNPLVVRPAQHARGENLYLCSTIGQLLAAVGKCGPGWYASEFINKVAEYRVLMVQGRVAWVAERNPPKDKNKVSWGDGNFYNVRWGKWDLAAVKVACQAFALSKLDFGAVDVMVDAAGAAYVSEINTAPQVLCSYKQECIAMCFDHMIKNGKDAIAPVYKDQPNWRDFIHPAMSMEAKVGA